MQHIGKFLLVFSNEILAALNRIVNRKVLEMDKERPVLVSLDEVKCGIGKFVRIVVPFFRWKSFLILRRDRMVIGAHPTGDGFVKPVGLGIFT